MKYYDSRNISNRIRRRKSTRNIYGCECVRCLTNSEEAHLIGIIIQLVIDTNAILKINMLGAEKMDINMKLQSRKTIEGPFRAPNRAMYKAMGLHDEI